MKKIVMSIILGLAVLGSSAQTNWVVDPSHSKVNFTVEHMVISEVDGNFKTFEGKMVTSKDDFTDAKISFSVDIPSVNTDNEKRDGHLQSEDFFYAEKFPKMTFSSTSFSKNDDKNYTLEGDLTVRGVTKRVVFDVKYGGQAEDGYGNKKAGFIAKGSINRIDYGVAWNSKTKQGGLTVGEEIEITLKLELVKS